MSLDFLRRILFYDRYYGNGVERQNGRKRETPSSYMFVEHEVGNF